MLSLAVDPVICTSLMVVQPRNLPCILQQQKITELDDTQWIEDEEDIQPLFTISEISEDS